MKIFRTPFSDPGTIREPVCLAIGVFDGVHRGHQALIQALVRAAAEKNGVPALATFDPHPRIVLHPEMPFHVLTSTTHKLRLFKTYGVGAVYLIPFSLPFASLAPEDFLDKLHLACPTLATVAVGEKWRFGSKREGSLDMLRKKGEEHGFDVLEHTLADWDGRPVSSTRIRESLKVPRLDETRELLGRPFSLYGKVVRGNQIGRTLGFPTVNLDCNHENLPKFGVYGGLAELEDGSRHKTAIHIGPKPTVGIQVPTVEAHILDFSGDLYEQEIELHMFDFLRKEKSFDGVQVLRRQIEEDVRRVRDGSFGVGF